jgi:hypothetical protein
VGAPREDDILSAGRARVCRWALVRAGRGGSRYARARARRGFTAFRTFFAPRAAPFRP